jgi:hypothetical protein
MPTPARSQQHPPGGGSSISFGGPVREGEVHVDQKQSSNP